MDTESKKILAQLISIQKSAFGQKYCSHPEASAATCSQNIIQSHTIQKGGILKKISEGGEVYVYKGDLFGYAETQVVVPKKEGLSKATTYFGFCDKHDREFYAPVETVPFTGTPEQCFLLAYRAIAKEHYAKKSHEIALEEKLRLLEQLTVPPLNKQVAKQFLESQLQVNSIALGDIERQKKLYDGVYGSRRFEEISYRIFWLDDTPPVTCCGACSPQHDFQGNLLQDHLNTDILLEVITCNIVATATGGAIVFAWHSADDKTSRGFIHSLRSLRKEQWGSAILTFVFEYFENLAIKPSWWEGLSEEVRDELIQRYNSGTSIAKARKRNALSEGLIRECIFTISRQTSHTINETGKKRRR